MSSVAKNQRQRILDLLLSVQGREVPSVALSHISLQYGARVKELREMGFHITNRTERRAGQVYGYFKLGPEPHESRPSREGTLPTNVGSPTSFPEFGSLAPERYPD